MLWSVSDAFWGIVNGMESTVLLESVIWHKGKRNKRLELLWEPRDLPVSRSRWEQFAGTAKNWHLVQLEKLLNSVVSQQTWKIRKNRETWQIRRAWCQPAVISCSEEAVGVAGENHKYCSAYWFILHWNPSTKWIWFILYKEQLFGKCLSFGFTRWL